MWFLAFLRTSYQLFLLRQAPASESMKTKTITLIFSFYDDFKIGGQAFLRHSYTEQEREEKLTALKEEREKLRAEQLEDGWQQSELSRTVKDLVLALRKAQGGPDILWSH